ncbi:MAG TPA: AAA family ATPase [Nocardioides sp.]|uniref:ATP-binding protein n=1 Tax=Nocardioides sp. TaxID=35761 RepID=UPI002E2EB9B9|nr:AAA family ATPase [Nocardioides sp.]HEX5088026.1 AAA family ATPase [Nocardioides sp.]
MSGVSGTSPAATLRGRDDEVDRLGAALDRAVAGRLSVVMIEGEAGIGKTRLLAHALGAARDRDCQVGSAKAEEMEQSRPFGVIAAALGCVPGAEDGRRARIGGLISAHDGPDLAGPTVSSDPGLQFRVVDALCDLVESLAIDRPLVLGLDDLQWADPSSLVTLSALARTGLGLPVALIGCCRPFPRSPAMLRLMESLQHAELQRIEVGQLADRDVRDVVTELVGATPGPGLLAVVAGAAGNPLFVTELLNAIRQDGSLRTTDGHAEVNGSDLPPSLHLTILGRLRSLPEEAIQVLRAGSLLGSMFSITELATILDRSVSELMPAVEAVIASGVLDEQGVLLQFRHDLIREAVYADMPSSLRLALHREAATRLAGVGSPTTRVADQFARGATRGDPEAIDWLTRAAREAESTSPETTAELLQRAVRLMEPSDPRRDVLVVERADTLMLAGRVTEAVASCESLLARGHRREADAPARLRLGAALMVNGRPAEALRALDPVTRSEIGTEEIQALGLSEASFASLWLGDFDEAERAAELALSVAGRCGNHRASTGAMATRSVVACMRGHLSEAIKLSDEAVALADDSPARVGHAFPVYATRGWIQMERDEHEAARRALSTGRQICEELGVRWPLATYQAYLAVERFVVGQWDDAVAELEAGIALAEETGVTYAVKPSLSAQAMIRLYRNDLPGARRAVEAAEAVADRGSRLFDYRVLLAQALLLEADGGTSQAYTALADRWRLCRSVGMAIDYPAVGPDLVRLARAAGDMDLAVEVAAAVDEVAARNQVPSITGAALRCRGLLADDLDAAVRAVDAYAQGHRLLEEAQTCEEAAGLAARRQDKDLARTLMEKAGGIFNRLDASRGVMRVDSALRALGVRRGRHGVRQRPQQGWDSLTPTEGTVAHLVAEGLSNPQIAERLFVSRRTVQTHVAHIFTKLDIASRAQLAAIVTEHRATRLAT